jgi:hypothetical protein
MQFNQRFRYNIWSWRRRWRESMKRPRPHIPLAVRVEVAEITVTSYPLGPWWALYCSSVQADRMTLGTRLAILLGHLPKGVQLDHDPALILREFNPRTGKYTPDANDPAYLIYREPDDHQRKTTGRKPGAERTVTTKGSDIGLKTKFARLERKPKRKSIIPSRSFSKQKRNFR